MLSSKIETNKTEIIAGPAWGMAVVQIEDDMYVAVANPNEWGNNYTPEEWAQCRKALLPKELAYKAVNEMRKIELDRLAYAPTIEKYSDAAIMAAKK